VSIVVSYSGLSFFDCPFGLRYSREYRRPKGQSKKENPEELTTMVTGQINVREYRRPKGQSKKDNPEELTTMVTEQINVREYRRPKGQSKKDNPE
jgi:hypothetical protein